MKTEVKKLEKSQVEVKAVFDKEEWKAAQDKALDKVAASAQLDGFRKGHAPKGLIKAKIGAIKASVKAVTIFANAPPMITPTAISITLPFEMNSLNSLNIVFSSYIK